MGQPRSKTKISAASYLEQEKTGDVHSEFINGEVYAMAGASDRHQYICPNIFVSLFPAFASPKAAGCSCPI